MLWLLLTDSKSSGEANIQMIIPSNRALWRSKRRPWSIKYSKPCRLLSDLSLFCCARVLSEPNFKMDATFYRDSDYNGNSMRSECKWMQMSKGLRWSQASKQASLITKVVALNPTTLTITQSNSFTAQICDNPWCVLIITTLHCLKCFVVNSHYCILISNMCSSSAKILSTALRLLTVFTEADRASPPTNFLRSRWPVELRTLYNSCIRLSQLFELQRAG